MTPAERTYNTEAVLRKRASDYEDALVKVCGERDELKRACADKDKRIAELELNRRINADLRTAIDLLKRGKVIAHREGWEEGETEEEWEFSVETFLSQLKLRLRLEREMEQQVKEGA